MSEKLVQVKTRDVTSDPLSVTHTVTHVSSYYKQNTPYIITDILTHTLAVSIINSIQFKPQIQFNSIIPFVVIWRLDLPIL